MSKLECFKCRKLGHYSWDCPENNNGVGNSNEKNPIPLLKGHLNHVNVEEVFEAPNAATHFQLPGRQIFLAGVRRCPSHSSRPSSLFEEDPNTSEHATLTATPSRGDCRGNAFEYTPAAPSPSQTDTAGNPASLRVKPDI
ncbi:hypothetical protein QYE76_058614 [Lolium multiflorum]|uniref:CCHC-type domain-containing protein n=1 Tax=Lolium multiflorum TaxID=4521 RepID=A0AAD8T7D8_LOLMU|nr:hypothetical protein QYE76_058614 [Lolium multiflorum]